MLKFLIVILFSKLILAQSSEPEIEWSLVYPDMDSAFYSLTDSYGEDYTCTAIDNSGNIFLLISNEIPSLNNYSEVRLTKFSKSGVQLWTEVIKDSVYKSTEQGAVAIDNDGNVYVAVYAYNLKDFYTAKANMIYLKFNNDGELLWKKRYGTTDEFPYEFPIPDLIKFDKEGNSIIGGFMGKFNFNGDWYVDSIMVLKYDKEGNFLWALQTRPDTVRISDYSGFEIDDSGNIFIGCIGYAYVNNMNIDSYALFKYNNEGKYLGHSKLSYSSNYRLYVYDFIKDLENNFYIAGGLSYPQNTPTNYEWLIVKFNSSGSYVDNINSEYESANKSEYAFLMSKGEESQIYILGIRYFMGNYFMALDKYDGSSISWEKRFDLSYNPQSWNIISNVSGVYFTAIDDSSNIHFLKYTENGDFVFDIKIPGCKPISNITEDDEGNILLTSLTNEPISRLNLTKFNSSGEVIWKNRLNNRGFHELSKIRNFKSDIFAAGIMQNDSADFDFTVLKINSEGKVIQGDNYQGPAKAEDFLNDFFIDKSGNFYLAGESKGINSDFDFAVIKYDSLFNRKWVARYNSSNSGADKAKFIKADNSGNIYVTGNSLNSSGNNDIVTIKYNSLGQMQWVKTYNGSSNGNDEVCGFEIVPDGNIFIGGTSDSSETLSDYLLIKYNSSGDLEWVRRYDGPAKDGEKLNAIILDDSSNIYITGWSIGNGTDKDFATVKYNSSGVFQWDARWNNPSDSFDEATDLKVENNNIYVAGFSSGAGTGTDFSVLKYNSSGNEQWAVNYDGPENMDDSASYIILDDYGNPYIIGKSSNSFAVVKLNQNGEKVWDIFPDENNSSVKPAGIFINASGEIFTGSTITKSSNSIWEINKYFQPGYIPLNVKENNIIPAEFLLYQNYPNPFNPATKLSFVVGHRALVSLKVYDILGNEVVTLVNEEKHAGIYEVIWNAEGLSSGVYFYRLTAGGFSSTKKLLLLK